MKKSVFLFVLIFAFVSCKKEKQEDEKKSEPAAVAVVVPCGENVIFVDASTVDSAWITANQTYICDDSTDSEIAIDTDKFAAPEILADWLKANGEKIDYLKSYATIEQMHIKTLSSSEISNLRFSNDTFTWEELQVKLNVETNDKYKKYVNISLNSTNNVKFTEHTNHYDKAQNNFSIPLFKAIANNHNLATNDVFHFAKGSNGETIFKVVRSNGTIILYYNYSQQPFK